MSDTEIYLGSDLFQHIISGWIDQCLTSPQTQCRLSGDEFDWAVFNVPANTV